MEDDEVEDSLDAGARTGPIRDRSIRSIEPRTSSVDRDGWKELLVHDRIAFKRRADQAGHTYPQHWVLERLALRKATHPSHDCPSCGMPISSQGVCGCS
jgi:hypothetical protein